MNTEGRGLSPPLDKDTRLSGEVVGAPVRRLQPWLFAALAAGCYGVVCLIYIQVSGTLASRRSESVVELASLESIKGTWFVLITMSALFAIVATLLTRVRKREADLAAHRRALMASEQRAAAGVFAASVAHDINNTLILYDFASKQFDEGAVDQTVLSRMSRQLVEANARLRGLAQRLMTIGKIASPGNVVDIDLRETVESSLDLVAAHPRVKLCDLVTELGDPVPFHGNPTAIHQLVTNLVLNAAEATGPGGVVRVRLVADRRSAELSVDDSGPGIPEAERARIFDALYTTKADGNGLGLLTVKACVAEHGGTITVDGSDLGGARFTVMLPRSDTEHATP